MADTLANKTYKDQYHFSKKYFDINEDALPSIDIDPEINTTIKKNPFRANVEIEKDEIILEPDLSALYNARGKKHSGGGIDVNLKPDSFVFSDDKTLSFSKGEQELFELKKIGGKFKAKNNTPARVLKRNIDLEHYNRLITNIEDPTKDDLAKKSSTMMLEKYIATLGNIAYAQEAKKGLPDGIPPFSMGTAPVYEPELKEDMDSQKQFARYGGSVRNPYLPMLQGGGRAKTQNARPGISGVVREEDEEIVIPCPPGYTRDPRTGRCIIPPQNLMSPPPLENVATPVTPPTPIVTSPKAALPTIDPKRVQGEAQNEIPIDWQFTPWQRVSHGWNAAKYAGAKRYMPMRSHINPTYTEPRLVNPEQGIGDMRAGYNSQNRAIASLSPILQNAQRSDAFGKYLDAIPGIRSQYDNQNSQILNASDANNNMIRNQALAQNIGFDQQYDQTSIAGRANFDNMKSFLSDQYMNNIMKDVQTNQQLAYGMASMNNPAWRYDFRTGKYIRNQKNILDMAADNSSREDILELTKSLKSQGYSDALIGNIIKSKVFQTAQPRIAKKGGRINPYK